MLSVQPRLGMLLLATTVGLGSLGAPSTVVASSGGSEQPLTAYLAGKEIPLGQVGNLHCHDLEYPVLRCFRSSAELISSDAVAGAMSAAAATEYVLIYDGASFSGASMLVSENYDALAVIGWNDRVSSFKGRNSASGRFYTDWFTGGTAYTFCCNQQVPTLGSWSNTFSSAYRT